MERWYNIPGAKTALGHSGDHHMRAKCHGSDVLGECILFATPLLSPAHQPAWGGRQQPPTGRRQVSLVGLKRASQRRVQGPGPEMEEDHPAKGTAAIKHSSASQSTALQSDLLSVPFTPSALGGHTVGMVCFCYPFGWSMSTPFLFGAHPHCKWSTEMEGPGPSLCPTAICRHVTWA